MCRVASDSAVALQKVVKPLGGPPAMSSVLVTGFAMTFASRKTRVVGSATE